MKFCFSHRVCLGFLRSFKLFWKYSVWIQVLSLLLDCLNILFCLPFETLIFHQIRAGKGRGCSPRRAFMAAVGVVLMIPVITKYVYRCLLLSFAQAIFCWPLPHYTSDQYVTIGFMTVTYSQCNCFGDITQDFLQHSAASPQGNIYLTNCLFQMWVLV